MRRISLLLAAASALLFQHTSGAVSTIQSHRDLPVADRLQIWHIYFYHLHPHPSKPSCLPQHLNYHSIIEPVPWDPHIRSAILRWTKSGQQIAYIPSISSSGSLGVYAGQCTKGSSFWIFTPSNDSATQNVGAGTWREMSTTPSASVSANALPDANFLASSFSFSTIVDSNDTQRMVYAFGGMCPTDTTSNSTTWQSAAQYSNSMLKLFIFNADLLWLIFEHQYRQCPHCRGWLHIYCSYTHLLELFSWSRDAGTEFCTPRRAYKHRIY